MKLLITIEETRKLSFVTEVPEGTDVDEILKDRELNWYRFEKDGDPSLDIEISKSIPHYREDEETADTDTYFD